MVTLPKWNVNTDCNVRWSAYYGVAALKTTENLIESNWWTEELIQAGVAACGKADSFLKASHITPT